MPLYRAGMDSAAKRFMASVMWAKRESNPTAREAKMPQPPTTEPCVKKSGRSDPSPSGTDLLPPSPYYLVRSNLPGLYFEIENPDTELPVVRFEFWGE